MDKPELDAQLKCPECTVQLEVISTDPLDVYYAFDEDWDVEWDDAD